MTDRRRIKHRIFWKQQELQASFMPQPEAVLLNPGQRQSSAAGMTPCTGTSDRYTSFSSLPSQLFSRAQLQAPM